jgi:protein-S-isoprenylcysteine O-methyltransferase Ste14
MGNPLVSALRVLATLAIGAAVCWLSGVTIALRSLLLVPGFLGLGLAVWANRVNPEGGKIGPGPMPIALVKTGPYRLVRHPMYVGQSLGMVFFMWYAAGFWAAFSLGLLAEIIFREYIWREEGSPSVRPNVVSGEASGGLTRARKIRE